MKDQASQLREMSNHNDDFYSRAESTRILAVTSGKGGVGKTNVSVNLSIALAKENWRVGIFDADLGLANIDVMLGLTPQLHLGHLLFGNATLDDILLEGPSGVTIVPASSGLEKMVSLSDYEQGILWSKLYPLLARLDCLLIDTAAGISRMVLDLLAKADPILLVVSDEPTSMVDAYALVKVLEKRVAGKRIEVIVNSVESEEEGLDIFTKLNTVTQNFLKRELDYLGWVAYDNKISEAVRAQKAIMEWKPLSPASRSYIRLARKLDPILRG